MQGCHVAISTHRVATRDDEEEVGCSIKVISLRSARCCATPSGAPGVKELVLLVVVAGRREGATGEIVLIGYVYFRHLHDS